MSETLAFEKIVMISALGKLGSRIKKTRPDTITIDGLKIRVHYHVEDATGAEYALIHVELPEPWQAQIDSSDLDCDTFGELWSFALPLD